VVYIPTRMPEIKDAEELRRFVEDELQRISQAESEQIEVELRPVGQLPQKPREGMIIYADGVVLFPGVPGLYLFNGTTWNVVTAASLSLPLAVGSGGTGSATAAGARTNLDAAARTQTFEWSGNIKTPVNQDFRLVERVPFAGTVTRGTVKLASGTCTATFKINTTGIGSLALSATSSVVTATSGSSNTFVATDLIQVTISSVASPIDLSWTLEYTRVLA